MLHDPCPAEELSGSQAAILVACQQGEASLTACLGMVLEWGSYVYQIVGWEPQRDYWRVEVVGLRADP